MSPGAALTASRRVPAPPPRGWARRAKRHRMVIAAFCTLVGVACITLLPFYWMFSSSLRTMENMFSIPIQWIPDPLNWQSYVLAWQAQDFTRYFLNSGFVAVAITLSNLLLCSLAGYSLTKFHFRGRGLMFILILSTMMLPLEVTMVPLFLIIKQLDWANSYQGLIVPFLVDGFGVFLMRQYMLSIPKDLIDSARIDRSGVLSVAGWALDGRHHPMSTLQIATGAAELMVGTTTYDHGARRRSCLLYTSPSPRDRTRYRMPSSA